MLENNELVKVNPVQIEAQHIKFNGYGIEFEGSPSIEEWYQTFQSLQHYNGIFQFCLGDLIVYAESPVTGWGESKYETLMEETSYDKQTLMNYASVSRRFDGDFRKEIFKDLSTSVGVSFGHFHSVASLEDLPAKHFLEMVRDGGWSVAKLREEVAKFKNGGQLPEPKESAELPDGWLPFKEISKELPGYIPAPKSVNGNYEPKYLIEFRSWELEKLKDDYENDPVMASLIDRIDMALETE